MAYDVIHETVILSLSDGRFLHLDSRSSNDAEEPRSHSEFSATVYTKEGLLAKAALYQKDSGPYVETGKFDLMIRDRKASWFDYGSHLIRLLKRAKSYNYFVNHRIVHIYVCHSVAFVEPEEKTIPLSEFKKYLSIYLYSCKKIAYRYLTEEIDRNNEQEVIAAIEKKDSVLFVIGKLDHSLISLKPRRK